MDHLGESKLQILSDAALEEKNLLLDNIKKKFNCYDEQYYGCGYSQNNEWNPFIYVPTFDKTQIYRDKDSELYNNVLNAVSGKISENIEKFEITDLNDPYRVLQSVDTPCYALRYVGETKENPNDRSILGEITGFVYQKHLQSNNTYFNLKLIGEVRFSVLIQETSKYILDYSKGGNILRFILNSSLGPLFSYKRLPSNVELHTVYIDAWPHIIVTTKPGVNLNNGDKLIADLRGFQLESNKNKQIHPSFTQLKLHTTKPLIPVLGIPIGTTVTRVVDGKEFIGEVVDFVKEKHDGLFVVKYNDGDCEFYTRLALMLILLKEHLKDSKLDQLLLPLTDYHKIIHKEAKSQKSSSLLARTRSLPLTQRQKIKKKSKITKEIIKTDSTIPSAKSPKKLKTIHQASISSTESKDSTVSMITRFRGTVLKSEEIESPSPRPSQIVEQSRQVNNEIANLIEEINTTSEIENKKQNKDKQECSVSFRRSTCQEIKELIPLKVLKEYCIDTLLELGRLRKNWRDFDNRKPFNYHFAKISSAVIAEDLEPQFTNVFYKLYQYLDITFTGEKITFDAIITCEKENPQLIDHLSELLTNIFIENNQTPSPKSV